MTETNLSALRKQLHQHPELSGYEVKTAQLIANTLREFEPHNMLENLGGHGVAAVFDSGKKGKTTLVRCELDALPIAEINDFAHKSVIENVSHKCGHDGHMTILIGLAKILAYNPPKTGRVVLLFQPAEEDGEGAKAVLADPRFKSILPDVVVSLHNIPGLEKHKIACKTGSFTASVRSMIIKLEGKTAHAGEPEMGINPARAIAEIIENSLALNLPIKQPNFKQVTPIQIEMGEEAYGISAGYGEVKFTIRTWEDAFMDELVADLKSVANSAAAKYNLKVTFDWTQFFAANQNNADVVEKVKLAAAKNGLAYEDKSEPFRWGEDFGLFTAKFPGAMFGLGAGINQPALHNPDYDFPDEIAPTGTAMFAEIINQING